MTWKKPIIRQKDLNAVKVNFDYFQQRAKQGNRIVAPVLKADAYGMGIQNIAPVLYTNGARLFFTSDVNEALEINDSLQATDISIYTLHGFDVDAWPAMSNRPIYPVLNNQSELAAYHRVLLMHDIKRSGAIQFNTGMNRCGFNLNEYTENFTSSMHTHVNVDFYMTHLCAVDLDPSSLQERSMLQLDKLKDFLTMSATTQLSVTATHGSLYTEHQGKMPLKQDIERIGIGIFGDIPEHDFAFSASAKILSVTNVTAGEKIGYDMAYTAKENQKVAVIDIGYGDGYPREASVRDGHEGKQAYMTIGGIQAPVIGLVAMNMTCVDVTNVPDAVLAQENYAEIIGKQTPIHHLAECSRTTIEDIMISLNRKNSRAMDYIIQ